MRSLAIARPRTWSIFLGLVIFLSAMASTPAQQWVTETRDPKQTQDEDFAKAYVEWTGEPRYGSPLVDHLPKVAGIPSPKDILGYHIGAPRKLTYYADIVKYYKALAAATPRVKVETIGKSDEGRELVVVWVSSDANIKNLQQNRDNLAKLADPRGIPETEIKRLISATKPHYHFMGGLHSSETGPSEMLMELVYRLAVETSPFISQIRDNVYVSVTPVADADGRDRNVDQFYCSEELAASAADAATANQGRGGGAAGGGGRVGGGGGGFGGGGNQCALPYWGKYVYHDNNRDINLSQVSMRAIVEWYYTAHPPIMHDLHEAQPLMYDYSGGPPQNPNLDPILFAELPFFANWELAQMTKWGMPGVYTHAFMDGWSPGYLGSVAYNHNGMMRMYETQGGRDLGPAPTATSPNSPTSPTSPAGASASAAGAATAGRGNRGGGGGRGGGGNPPAAGAVAAGAAATTEPPANAGAGGQGAGGGRQFPPGGGAGAGGGAAIPGAGGGGGRGGGNPTGRGGGQDREWYRGIPIPPGAQATFTRRNNTNYMETGVLSGLQLTSMFPNLVLENFYTKTKNSIEQTKTQAPYGYVIPQQRDMTKPAELVRILRLQGIEVGQTTAEFKIGDATYGAGSYVIKGGQPYWRLAKNFLEKQDYPDARLQTYDDSGWTMGYAFNVDVKEVREKAVLDVNAPLVKSDALRGKIAGSGTVGLAVAHYGSNNMISFRYKLKNVPMKIAEKSFTASGVEFPAGSFVLSGAITSEERTAVEQLGLTGAALTEMPTVAMHDADAPRVAIYSQWNGTQELGWYRDAFDKFGIPYELIYKERVAKGNLKNDYDVIVMAAQNINRAQVLSAPNARPSPYQKSDKYKFLGMYGETTDTSGGFGQTGVEAFQKFFEAGGTLIATVQAVRFPIDFGFAHSVDTETVSGVNAQKPLVQSEIVRTDHPVFYGYGDKILPIKYAQGQTFLRVGPADEGNVLARFVGGDSAVLSGLMEGGSAIAGKAFAVDIPEAYHGKGRVIMFTNNPVYRWQNHGEFNMVFNSILNWNDVPPPPPMTAPAGAGRGGRGGGGR
jgi:Zinc carboxypeptidase